MPLAHILLYFEEMKESCQSIKLGHCGCMSNFYILFGFQLSVLHIGSLKCLVKNLAEFCILIVWCAFN